MKSLLLFAAVIALLLAVALIAAALIWLAGWARRISQDYAPGDVPERMSATDAAGMQ